MRAHFLMSRRPRVGVVGDERMKPDQPRRTR